jgi:hypothetical protein
VRWLRLFTLAQFINDWGYLAKVESQVVFNMQPDPTFIFKAVKDEKPVSHKLL